MAGQLSIAPILQQRRTEILASWKRQLLDATASSRGRITPEQLDEQATQFLTVLLSAMAQPGATDDLAAPEWKEVRAFLDDLSAKRVVAGFSSDETATFVFSLKRSIFDALQQSSPGDTRQFADNLWSASTIIDRLGLHTVKAFQKTREQVISRQQQDLLELSTPVVKLWEGIVALPMIGTLDSARTQIVMESLLQKIVETESQIAIIDITGVPTVDTLVAQHLLKTVTAIRLMGAECIISGIRPQIAQTIVHLGVDLQGVMTKANLSDALAQALKRNGVSFTKQ